MDAGWQRNLASSSHHMADWRAVGDRLAGGRAGGLDGRAGGPVGGRAGLDGRAGAGGRAISVYSLLFHTVGADAIGVLLETALIENARWAPLRRHPLMAVCFNRIVCPSTAAAAAATHAVPFLVLERAYADVASGRHGLILSNYRSVRGAR